MNKPALLLINLGTPDSPSYFDVFKYLREFLMDGRVIDIPYIFRFLLYFKRFREFADKEWLTTISPRLPDQATTPNQGTTMD